MPQRASAMAARLVGAQLMACTPSCRLSRSRRRASCWRPPNRRSLADSSSTSASPNTLSEGTQARRGVNCCAHSARPGTLADGMGLVASVLQAAGACALAAGRGWWGSSAAQIGVMVWQVDGGGRDGDGNRRERCVAGQRAGGQHRLQAGRYGRQLQQAAVGRAPTFEQLQLQRPGLATAHQQPQRCGRGLVAAALRPKNKDQAFKLHRALICRRRICSGCTWGDQASTAAAALALSSCSSAQSWSCGRLLSIHTSCAGAKPHWASPR